VITKRWRCSVTPFRTGATARSHVVASFQGMKDHRTKPWRRRSSLRASRRRHVELEAPSREAAEAEPLPPLEPPDDDREFLPHARALALDFVPIPRPGHA
jgi:hypothetical protein